MKKVIDFNDGLLKRLEGEQRRRKDIALYKTYPMQRVIVELLDQKLTEIERGL